MSNTTLSQTVKDKLIEVAERNELNKLAERLGQALQVSYLLKPLPCSGGFHFTPDPLIDGFYPDFTIEEAREVVQANRSGRSLTKFKD